MKQPPPTRCYICAHWDPQDDQGGRLARTPRRRCRRWPEFFPKPDFVCDAFKDKENGT